MPSLQDFKRLKPHLEAALTLYQEGGMPHALLIHGPAGVGKKTLARLLCMLLVCKSDHEKPCGHCDGCTKATHGTHSNILLFPASAQSAIKIDDMRAVLNALGQHGLEEGHRVIFIEEADRMTPQAQNALLKSLEEPDKHTYFILTSVSEKGLLPTILSRTGKLYVPLWDRPSMVALLKSSGYADEKARHLAAVSGGSPGLAFKAENDSELQNTLNLLNDTFFRIRSSSDIPAASNLLKNAKDSADMMLDMMENRLSDALMTRNDPAERSGIFRMLAALSEARRYRSANVSWQSIADRLLFHALEDLHSCQWS